MTIDMPRRRDRREWMLDAACAATAAVAGGLALPTNAVARSYGRSLLVGPLGEPLLAASLKVGEPMLFNYPFVSSPVFLLLLEQTITPTDLATKAQGAYTSPAGVGPTKSIVAFTAICAHKLMYPTPQVSFIGVRKGVAKGEPAHVIHCCGDDSRYDPNHGARVLAGPAPQPLAAVQLEWDAKADTLHAIGVLGAEPFEAFFEKYAFKLELDHGAKARSPTGATSVVLPAASYAKQWQTCRARGGA